MNLRVGLVQSAPDHPPGSMSAYGRLVREAVRGRQPDSLVMMTVPFHRQMDGASMWVHHRWRILHGRGALGQADADLFHLLDGSMAAFIPRHYWPKLLVTVHDLIPCLQWRGDLDGPRPSWPAKWIIRRSLHVIRHARAICAVSEATKADLQEITGRTDAVVIPHAVRPLNNCDDHLDLPARFILHVGNNATYKNRTGVVRVFAELKRMADLRSLELIMAGPPPGADLLKLARNLSGVTFMTDVSDRTLATLYRKAQLLIFPSHYEGYGMPVIEAMAAECPVVCSNARALTGLAGDAALSAPADNISAIAGLCREVLTNHEMRNRLIARGKQRADMYSLSAMGQAMCDWYYRNR